MTIEDFKLKEVFLRFHFHPGSNPIDQSISGTRYPELANGLALVKT